MFWLAYRSTVVTVSTELNPYEVSAIELIFV